MKTFVGIIEENNELILEYCKKCGCELTKDAYGFGFVLRDGKREIVVRNKENIINEAAKLHKIHQQENKLENEKDFKKRRLIKSHLYFIDSMPE